MSDKHVGLCEVEFQPLGKRVRLEAGRTVLAAAQKAGVELAADCGGKGRCGRCRVKIAQGRVPPPDPDEAAIMERNHFGPSDRLACRTVLAENAKVFVPASSMRGRQVLELAGINRPPDSFEAVERLAVTVDQPSLKDQRSDTRRLFDGLDLPHPEAHALHPRFVLRLSDLIRAHNGSLTAFVRNGAALGVGEPDAVPYGIALDIGTTSIAGRLVDLSTGEEAAAAGAMNPQIAIGEDVISRVHHAMKSPGGQEELSAMLLDSLNSLVEFMCAQADASPLWVMDMVLCANTAISHLLLKLPASYLARAPYPAGFSLPLELTATDLGLSAAPCARVTILPCIQGFIGGDHVAMVLACGIDRADDTVLGIDIGTNTEIVLAKPGPEGGMFVASCASGPALEGAHIRDGMRAGPGAIERVRIHGQEPRVKTIKDQKPVGICGSGIIDALAELVKAGLIDQMGHLAKEGACIISSRKSSAYCLVPCDQSGSGDDIIVTQRDISEIQLAKAAINAGVRTVLEKTGTPLEQVSAVYLAGAFGSHIDIDSAVTIGLLPDLPRDRFIQAGNAASGGALLVLLSQKERERAARIAQSARQVELAADPMFNRLMARALRFNPPQTV